MQPKNSTVEFEGAVSDSHGTSKGVNIDTASASAQKDETYERKHTLSLPQDSVQQGTTETMSKTTEETEDSEQQYFPMKYSKSVTELAKREQSIDLDKLPKSPSVPDADNVIYMQAVSAIKKDPSEKTVMAQLENMWIMYEDVQRRLHLQNGTLMKYRRLIAKQEEDAQHDKRVLQAVYYADKHRRERKELEKFNSELEKDLKERDEEIIPNMQDRLKMTTKQLEKLKTQTKAHNKLQERFMDLEFSYNKCQTRVTSLTAEADEKADIKAKEHATEINQLQTRLLTEKNTVLLEKTVHIGILNRKIDRLTLEKQHMGDELRTLQRGFSNSEQHLQICEEQLKKCRAKVQNVEQANHILEAAADTARQNAQHLEMTRKRDEDALRLAKTDLHDMNKTNEENRIEIAKLNFDLNGVRKSNRLLEEQKKKVQEALTSQRNRITSILLQNSSDKKDIEKLNIQLNKGQQDMKLLTQQCEVLSSKLNKVRGDLGRSEDLRKQNVIENSFCTHMTKHLERDVHQKQGMINNFVKQADKLCKHVIEVHTTLKTCEENNSALQQFVESLEKKQDELMNLLKEEESLTFNMSRKNASQLVKMGILKDMLQQKDEELQRNVLQISNLVYETNKFLSQNTILQNEVDRVTHSLSVKTRESKLLEQTVATMKREAYMKQQAINHLNMKINEMKEKLKNQQLDNHDMERMRDYQQGRADMKETELKMLQERMSVSENRLSVGTSVLINRSNDVRILIVEVKNLRRKLRLREEDCKNHRELKESYVSLGRKFTLTKAKLKALEQMKDPRIHPMRHLQAVNPTGYELHTKVNHLKQQLIRKITEITEKETIIVEKNKLFLELKTLLIRRGNTDKDNEEIWNVQKTLQSKDKQIKSLEAELSTSMYTAAVAKEEMTKNKQQLDETKREMFKQKNIIRRKNQRIATALAPPKSPPKSPQKKTKVPKLPPV